MTLPARQHRRRRTGRGWAALTILFTVCCGIYYPALSHYFIADDFINLEFVRTYRGSLADFLDPRRMPSDPVTQTRYKPGYVYYFWALDRIFGDHPVGYHIWSLALHAAVGALVLLLVARLTRKSRYAFLAALLFVTSRTHVQMVLWASANYRLASTALVFGAMVALFSRRAPIAIIGSCLMFLLALSMNPEVIVLTPILGAILLQLVTRRGADERLGWRFVLVAGVDAIVSAAFVWANHISSLRFAELPISAAPSPKRILLFLVNVLLPFELPIGLKVATTLAVLATLAVRSVPLLAGTLASAVLWGCLEGYALAPRYFYISSAFAVSGLIFFLDWLTVVGFWPVKRWMKSAGRSPWTAFRRFRHAATWTVCALFVIANMVAIRRVDLVHWDYLQLLGQRLHELQQESRNSGRRPAVFISPSSHLTERDLDLFRHDMDFVEVEEAATDVVSTDLDRYRVLLSPRLDDAYWYLPWLVEGIGR